MLVSVVVPIYNAEKYLCKCLESIKNQSLLDIEIICVNDGSTDDSERIIDEFAGADSRFVVIKKRNTGYGNSVNIGINAAKGKYLSIVEADDYIDENMLEELVTIAEKNNVDVIKTDSKVLWDSENESADIVCALPSNKRYMYHNCYSCLENMDVFSGYVYTWAGIYRLSYLNKYGIRHNETPGASYQDNGFWFQTTMYASKLYFHDKAYYYLRRDNPDSSFYSKDKLFCISEEYDFIEKTIEYSQLPNSKKLYERCFLWRIKNYISQARRISDEDFAKLGSRMKADVQRAVKNEWIDYDLFEQDEKEYISHIIMEDNLKKPGWYYVFSQKNGITYSSNLYVYGAGKRAEAVYHKLKEWGLWDMVTAVVVTNKNNNPDKFYEKNIYLVKDLELANAGVILGISINNASDIIKYFDHIKFSNFMYSEKLLSI